MFSKSTWLHLRIPFSFFLLPVFLFALSTSPNLLPGKIVLVFISLHFFLYPASNGYNSYFDKDEKSIGGLRNPPKVNRGLYFTSLLFDALALILGYFVSIEFMVMLLVYGLVSKAYSHPSVRLKKYPYISWLVAGFFQGAFTYVMAYMGLNQFGFDLVFKEVVIYPALLSSAILWGSYPMTQIYQHEEDLSRGDITLSSQLGIQGTFYFTAILFSIASVLFFIYFRFFHEAKYGWAFLVAMTPIVGYFNFWFFRVLKDPGKADFSHTMYLNFISAIFLNAFFIYFLLDRSHLLNL